MARVRGPVDFKKRSSKQSSNSQGNKLTSDQKNAISSMNGYKAESLNGTYNADEPEKVERDKTVKRPIRENIVPNPLFKFASYTTIFTLSALTQGELENPDLFLKNAPHDIIVRSGGIGDPRPTDNLSAENQGTIKSDLGQQALREARENLKRGRDLYFNKVEMNSVPSLNEQRKMTSVTMIDITITEPLGISLLDKMRGAAANCNYLDHISAPYMLSMEFRGFDELGNLVSTKDQTLTRRIPVKITNMELDVNQGSTVYTLKAIPYNEHGFLNHHVYLRTAGIIKKGNTMQETMDSLAELMNKQADDDVKQKLCELADRYEIVVHPYFNDKAMFDDKKTSDIPVGPNQNKPEHLRAAQVKTNDNVLTIITELMKTLEIFTNNETVKEFKERIEADNGDDMYFDYFMINSSVVPDSERFDRIRGKHPRKIKFHIAVSYTHLRAHET